MSVSDSQLETVVKLADEYLARLRRGEYPSVTEYVQRYPHLADGIREVFPMSAMVEDLRTDSGAHSGGGTSRASRAAARPTLPLGRLGNYRILREIGCGGMGVVYEAEHTRLQRHVALKVLHAGGRIAPGQRERFEREARAAAKLHHTNIVPVFDVGEEDGTTFYAMQFIRGQGLDNVVDELRQVFGRDIEYGRPATADPPAKSIAGLIGAAGDSQLAHSGHYWRSVARIGIQVADALQHAHDQGTLHRDVKPSNLLLDADGVVWVADFGLARLEDEAGLTQSGEFVGTLRYMAPERFEGQCDARSDVYSLGLTLYELATFRPAFSASSRHRVIRQVTQEQPPGPRKVNPAIPRDLETILLTAVAREPAQRYQTAEQLRADLGRFVEGKPIAARRSGVFQRMAKWSKRRPLVAGLLAGVILSTVAGIAGITWQWREAESARDAALQLAANERLALEEKTRALADADQANRVAQHQLARLYEANGLRLLDGGDWHGGSLWLTEALAMDTQLAFGGSAEHRHRLGLGRRRLANLWRGSPTLVALQSIPSYRCHYVTDDGSVCITDDGHQTYVWDVASGEELYPPLAAQLAAPHAVSPDGERLLLFDAEGVRVHDLRSGQRLETLPLDDVFLASWACGGKRIVALNLKGVLRIWDTATASPVAPDHELGVPPAVYHSLFAFAVSQDGERLALQVNDRKIPVFNVRTAERIAEFTTPNTAVGIVFSSDGRQLATYSRVLQVWDVDSAEQAPKFEYPLGYYMLGHVVAFSPDGSRIAFGDNEGIVLVRDLASGKDVFPPLVHAAAIHSVAFSPDGQRLVTAGHDATVRVWDASTSRRLGPVLRHEESVVAHFRSESRRVVTATRSGVIRIWDLSSIDEHRTFRGHSSRVATARFSPDGRRLVTGDWDGTVRVWDAASGEETVSPLRVGDRVMSISLDDGALLFILTHDRHVHLWDAQTGLPAAGDGSGETGEEPPFGEFEGIRVAQIEPDGRFLLMGRHRQYGIFDRSAPTDESGFVYFGSYWDHAIGGAFDAAGERAIVWSGYGGVHVVDVATREILLKRPAKPRHPYPGVVWAGFGAGQDEVLVARTDGVLERWRISTGEPFAEFEVNVEPRRAQVNTAGDRLVMAGRDHTFRVWDVAEGVPLTPPARHTRQIERVAFSPDGEAFVTASLDGTARVWDTATGQPVTPLLRHAGEISWAEFHPDGRQVVTAGEDGIVRLWQLAAADERPVSELVRLSRLYSSRGIERGAGAVPLTGDELERLFRQAPAESAAK